MMLQTHLQNCHFEIKMYFLPAFYTEYMPLDAMHAVCESHMVRTEGRQLKNSMQLIVFLWLTLIMLKWVTQSRKAELCVFSHPCCPGSIYLTYPYLRPSTPSN